MDKSQTEKPSRSAQGRRVAKDASDDAGARDEGAEGAQAGARSKTAGAARNAESAAKKGAPAREEREEAAADGEEEDDEHEPDDGESDDGDDADEAADDEGDEEEAAKPRARAAASARAKAQREKEKQEEAKRGRWRDLVGVVVCVVCVLFGRASLADHYVVPTGSMEPTVAVDDRVVVAKSAYGLRVPLTDFWLLRWGGGPQRGDVVVLESPEGGTILLKRVVGLPGDTITVHGGEISINGSLVPVKGGVEDLLGKEHLVRLGDGGRDFPNGDVPSAKLPPSKYLVMGDNRGNSKDGRYFGLVDEDAILGHAVRIYWSGDSAKSWFSHFSWKPL